ncbi:MAG TPA: class I SAM-dependent methyltransferase [Candidatus Acidoferrales bacterium]|nr:class I SAM-dependent methyltransferase [Candidatus Acidoferrales bacterium]
MSQPSPSWAVPNADPPLLDWASAPLPPAWPDQLNFLRPADLFRFLRRIIGGRRPVELPEGLPGRERLPAYLLKEFHHLPNGTYSKRVSNAYARWFDRVMLGTMPATRRRVAGALRGCDAALDVGCGAGDLAGALREQGTSEVWGLDACSYLLNCAARRHPNVRFVQGLVEESGFPDERFAGIGACFLFHELPPDAADRCLTEIHRILKPGGVLSIAEPAREHFVMRSLRGLVKLGGWRAIYFGILGRVVYEPAVAAWHSRQLSDWFPRFGFTLEQDESRTPFRFIVARKQPGPEQRAFERFAAES